VLVLNNHSTGVEFTSLSARLRASVFVSIHPEGKSGAPKSVLILVLNDPAVRRCAAQVMWLAGPGVLLCTAILGALFKWSLPYGWGWDTCLMFGAILSATDPVAVVSLLKEVGASKRLGHIIEGESLVNDGTAIVVFKLLNDISKGTARQVLLITIWDAMYDKVSEAMTELM
jgi:NhaP-type Na+/H+ or K+/H+ antiporter